MAELHTIPQHKMTEKELFIQRELKRHGNYIAQLYERDLGRRRLINSGLLIGGIKGPVYSIDAATNTLSFKFPNYGRFIEINYNKKKRFNSQSLTSEARKAVWGIKNQTRERTKRKKNTNWYTRNTYGAINKLIGNISWGYTEEIAADMRQEILKMQNNEP